MSLEKQRLLHVSSTRPVAAAVAMLSNKQVVVVAAASEAASTGSVSLTVDQSLH